MHTKSRMSRLRWRSLALLAATALIAAACGTDDDPTDEPEAAVEAEAETDEAPEPDAEPDPDAEEVTLTFQWWGGAQRHEYTEDVVDLFEEAYPHIAVNREPTDWDAYWERLAVQVAGGAEVEIISMHPNNLAQYASEGVLANLQPFIDEGILDVSEVPDGILDAGRYQGDLYMISMGNPYMALQYDRDALEADGVTEPPLDWTWDYYFEWLAEWAAASGEGAPWPAGGHADGEQQFFGWLIGQGLQPFTEDGQLGFEREHLGEWYERWYEMQEIGAIPPPDVVDEESTPNPEDSMIVRGRIHQSGFPSNQLQSHDELSEGHLVLMPLPYGPEGPGHVLLPAGLSISANASEEAQRAAAQFISFFINDPDAGIAYRADNGVPGTAAQRNAMIETGEIPERQVDVFNLFDEVVGPELPHRNALPEAFPLLLEALERYWFEAAFDRMSPQEAADGLFDEIEDEFTG